MKAPLRAAFAATALLLCILPAMPRANAASPALPTGSSAPEFALPDTDGRVQTLSQWRGKIVVLNFWAFWCDTWKAEMPSLQELAARQPELNFQMAAISVDATRLQEYLRRTKTRAPFPVLLDVGAATSRDYKIAHVPTVVILDPTGHIRYIHFGYPGNDAVLSQIRKITSAASAGKRPGP